VKQSRRRAVPCSELFWLTQPKTRISSEHGVALVWGEPAGRKLLSISERRMLHWQVLCNIARFVDS